ncbi:hypothetical protein [Paenibacillus amylolyticus]|uniref:hypothetical protein n=1 Tax=Paenibacillus amylolyticus TaxID=1451 RepID=UPI003EB76A82
MNNILLDILDAYGIRLGLEFVGCHHLRTQSKNPFLWRVEDILDWIDAIQSNVVLLVDSYHWHTNGIILRDIMKRILNFVLVVND